MVLLNLWYCVSRLKNRLTTSYLGTLKDGLESWSLAMLGRLAGDDVVER